MVRDWINEEQEMPTTFGAGNQQWIKDEIQNAIDARMPSVSSGWRKAGHVIVSWGTPAAIVGILISLFGVTCAALYQSFSHVKEETEFRTKTAIRLSGIESSLLAIRASRAAMTPTEKQSQKEAVDILDTAKKAPISLSATVVEEAGRSFVEASKNAATAWPVALDFAAYRTSLNSSPAKPSGTLPGYEVTWYHVVAATDAPTYKVQNTAATRLPISESARYEFIDQPMKQDAKTGPAWIIVTGSKLLMDGMYIRRAVITDAEIHYSGSRIILENVVFINCTFVFDNVPNSRNLGDHILADSRVYFRPIG